MSLEAIKGAMCPAHLQPARGACARCGAFVCETCPLGRFCAPCQGRIRHLRGEGSGVVVAPGLAMAMVGGLGFFVSLMFAAIMLPNEGRGLHGDGLMSARDLPTQVFLGVPILGGALLTAAGIQMARNRAYGLAVAGAVVAIIPMATTCWIVSLGVGIWALVVLRRPEVRAVFEAEAEGDGPDGP